MRIKGDMKLKAKITGPKVHDVGYRIFLMINAIDLGLKGFHARNRTGEKGPEVTALVEGDEETIADFCEVYFKTLYPAACCAWVLRCPFTPKLRRFNNHVG
jgi:acylphosphatase